MSRIIKAFNKVIAFSDKNGRGYEVKAKKNKEAEIWIYEEIGDSWLGGISAKQFARDVKDLGEVDRITVRINSPGGDVFDGIAIYNILKQHKAEIAVFIDGLAASIASVLAMAGDTISMADNAMMMIHNAWTIAAGDADMLRDAADMLEKVDAQIVKTYMTRAKDEAQIIAMMDAETWMTAEEANALGLVDELTESMELAACWDLKKFKYRNAPAHHDAGALTAPTDIRRKIASMKMKSLSMASRMKKRQP